MVFACLWLLYSLPAIAQTSAGAQLQPVPQLTGRVIDQSGTLSSTDVQSLSEQLKRLEDETGAQLVVLMVPSTAPEDIAAYAWRVASSWKLGRKEIGDGSLIVVAKNDRRMRIEVARKLEGAIPDIMAARIIDGAMKPRFRNDDYAGGLSAAIDQMSLLIHGEKLPAPEPKRANKSWAQYTDFLLPLLFFGFPIGIAIARAIFGRFLGSLVVAGIAGATVYVVTTSIIIAGIAAVLGLLFTLLSNLSGGGRGGGGGPYISTGGGGWSGGGGSFGGGGGFSSGGGGSFGGGGASGDW
ncbi:MAG: TPM domain-containing protein [Comamonas sp.]|uniref:TPM domain-containing protein n=1 Tax=Comamonas sp. TaxID=34028 RepID=UPI00281E584B|nr:TPM domain-containing protein [Comamonas sp.]MDR0217156.1 TPM domain-containing protein [Comamonas sp.]